MELEAREAIIKFAQTPLAKVLLALAVIFYFWLLFNRHNFEFDLKIDAVTASLEVGDLSTTIPVVEIRFASQNGRDLLYLQPEVIKKNRNSRTVPVFMFVGGKKTAMWQDSPDLTLNALIDIEAAVTVRIDGKVECEYKKLIRKNTRESFSCPLALRRKR
jgi:hypothetical protein